MKYSISNHRLNTTVNELGEEYKDLIIERLLDDTHEIDVDEINLSDLIRLDVMIKSNLRTDHKARKRNQMFTVITTFGMLYAVMGLMVIMWSLIQDTTFYNSTMIAGMLLVFLGLMVSIFALSYKQMLQMRPPFNRERRHIVSAYEIANKWKELEATIFQLLPDNSQLSLSSVINSLEKEHILSEDDMKVVKKLLDARNCAVHDLDKFNFLPQNEIKLLLIESDKIIRKLS